MPKKSFINKKDANTVTFRGVRQSQDDPLSGDYKVPPLIFVPATEADSKKKVKFSFFENPLSAVSNGSKTPIQRLLAQKGPRPDWDPDIVAALDDDFDYDNEDNILEDDFMAVAGTEVHKEEGEADSNDGYLFSDDDDSQFSDIKTKTGLTQYSLTSARTAITEEHKMFNEKFEKFCETYDDDQIGDLEGEDIAGNLVPENDIVDEFIKDLGNRKNALFPYDNRLELDIQDKIINLSETVDDEKMVKVTIERPEEYDCESIISTYSNKYNHPTLIRAEPRKKKLTKSHLKQLNRENEMDEEECENSGSDYSCSVMTASTFRPKNETPEQRRIRKQAVKQIRRENRAIKKENKLAFKEEKKRQIAVDMNVRRNVGVRMF